MWDPGPAHKGGAGSPRELEEALTVLPDEAEPDSFLGKYRVHHGVEVIPHASELADGNDRGCEMQRVQARHGDGLGIPVDACGLE